MPGKPAVRIALVLAAACAGTTAAPASAATVASGPLRASLDAASGRLVVAQGGRPILAEVAGAGTGPTGRLGIRIGGVWRRATRAVAVRRSGRAIVADLATTDPAGRRLRATVAPDGDGALTLRVAVAGATAGVEATGIAFGAARGERWLGFGERSNAVDQRGSEVENFVEEGPYLDGDYPLVRPSIPPWGLRERPDATYFPMPWLLSTGGWGALVRNTQESRFRLESDRQGAWSAEVDAARLSLTVLAGPRPAQVLRRLTTVTGRQPRPPAPWVFGPWVQTGHENTNPDEQGYFRILRAADAPVSVAETHMRYMPCGVDRGQAAVERRRTAAFRAQGLATVTYLREAVCADDAATFAAGVAQRLFTRRADGSPYTYRAFVGGRVTDVAQIDFSNPGAGAFYATIQRRATANGYDGWMEDYGEYTPLDSVSANGMRGTEMHNLYPVLYHRAGFRYAQRAPRPTVRFNRSGWTGVHPYSQITWGGDPSTSWRFDGLASSVTQALNMGLSGISTWGSDIGGFFTLSGPKLDAELLARWIQFGAVSGVMRTKAEGIGTPLEGRPQVWQRPTLPIWRRYAKLRTQLYPYLVAADRAYARTGLPLMRHLALAYPDDRRAVSRDDQFLFGPDLLVAPVTQPGQRRRATYLPPGRWVDLWRSARVRATDGGLHLGRVRLLAGARTTTLPAPLAELPLLARAGTLLPLLPADVDTLSDTGSGPGLVRLRDRRDRLDVLAFPRGRSAAAFDADGRMTSQEGPAGWTLDVRAGRVRTIRLQASLATLVRPFRPSRMTLDGRDLPRSAWRYDARTRVLRAAVRVRSGRLVIHRR